MAKIWTGDGSAHLAKSLLKLYEQVNAMAPLRDTSWDGSIGDSAHAARKSDHNLSNGIVHAIDLTTDAAHGADMQQIADQIIASRDSRVKYLIHNKRISNPTIESWKWRPYSGSNDHTHHLHVSVNDVGADDDADWNVSKTTGGTIVQTFPLLKLGSQGTYVRELQALLGTPIDGVFGNATLVAVKAFQAIAGLTIDGDVGPNTWQKLLTAKTPGKLNTDIMATVFNDAQLAYGTVPIDTLGFALPARLPKGTQLWVRNRANGNVVVGPVIDIGPWHDDGQKGPPDPYWETGARPRRESEAGGSSNKAGIDLYPEAARALGVQFIERDGAIVAGEAQVDWGFLDAAAQPQPQPQPEPAPQPLPADLAHAVAALMAITATLQDTNRQLQAAVSALTAAIGAVPKTGTSLVPVPKLPDAPANTTGRQADALVQLLPIIGGVAANLALKGTPVGQAKMALDIIGQILGGLNQNRS